MVSSGSSVDVSSSSCVVGDTEKLMLGEVTVEQTRGQRQTRRNDLPGRVRRLLSGWWMLRARSVKIIFTRLMWYIYKHGSDVSHVTDV